MRSVLMEDCSSSTQMRLGTSSRPPWQHPAARARAQLREAAGEVAGLIPIFSTSQDGALDGPDA